MSHDHGHGDHKQGDHGHGDHKHYQLEPKTAVIVGLALLVLTAVTVASAHVDLGRLNFPLAMLIATTKALLVIMIFMDMRHERGDNKIIFGTSFIFLAIFFTLTSFDIFFRQPLQPAPIAAAAGAPSQFKKAWTSSPELIAHGKELFAAQCVSCHGANGQGDGAAAAALNPRPRNFHSGDSWKIGRKPSQVFKTLKEGVPGSAMGAYATLSTDDRWGLVHYVLSLGPSAPADSSDDLAKVGIDPSKENGGGEVVERKLPVDFVIERMAAE